MSNLDKKLKQAVRPLQSEYPEEVDGVIEAIKQAFIDEGMFTYEQAQLMVKNSHHDCMTGPEWLARFKAEFEKLPRHYDETVEIYEAARRAAGVDHE